MLEDNIEHFNFIENLMIISMIDKLFYFTIPNVTDCQEVLTELQKKGVTNLDRQQ
jgi:competence protein ComGC